MVHSEVYLKYYLNKYVVSIAPFSTPAFTLTPHSENCSFCMFSLFGFSLIFPGGQLTPFAPCADARDRLLRYLNEIHGNAA